MNIKNIAFVLLVISIFIFGGVILFQPKTHYSYSGMVVDKKYLPAKSWTTYDTTCTKTGSVETCRTTPNYHYEPEHFYLVVFGNDEKRDFSVTADRYLRSYSGDTKVDVGCWKGQWIGAVFCDLR